MFHRGERRRLTKRIIKKRKIKLSTILCRPTWWHKDPIEDGDIYEGELKNNNMMNAYGGGCYRKTSARKACATYRHHGAYGAAKQYTSHDKRQIEDGENQLAELYS